MFISPAAGLDAVERSSHAALRDARADVGAQDELPPELAFLLRHGFPRDILERAAAEADAIGSTADVVLVADGRASEDLYYRSLADELGVDFVETEARFPGWLAWREAARTCVVQLADGHWLMAPRGPAVSILLSRVTPQEHRGRLAITTPHRFAAMLQASLGPTMAREAGQGLAFAQPQLSAHSGATEGQKLAAAVALAIVASTFIVGGEGWLAICLVYGLVCSITVGLRLMTALASFAGRQNDTPLSDADLPSYTILVALYREAAVVPGLFAALERLDYPKAKRDIIFLLEADDEDTYAALEAADQDHCTTILRVPAGSPRTKPRALNYGLFAARGELLVIYDAEDQPEPDQLRKAAARFAGAGSDVACLQASLAIDNLQDGWLTRLFSVDYAGLFDVFNPGLAALQIPMPLGGTSNHFRTQVLRDIGGWDAWNVTEDADLGLRLARAGFVTASLDSTTWEEAPAGLRNWFAQRRRWMKGWMQTTITHTRDPILLVRQVGAVRAILVISTLMSNTLGPLIGPFFMAYVLHDAIAGDLLAPKALWPAIWSSFWIMLAASGLSAIVLPSFIGMTRRRLWASALYLFLRPVHMLLMSCAAAAALFDLVRQPFHWAKTEHGLARRRLTTAPPSGRA